MRSGLPQPQILPFDNLRTVTLSGMTLISKIAGTAIGILVALWVMAFWDARQADVLCDTGQDAHQLCQRRFLSMERHKHILEPIIQSASKPTIRRDRSEAKAD